MLLRLLIGFLVIVTFASGAFVHPAAAVDDAVVSVPGDDPEMAAAIAKARASLPTFWKAWEAPKPGEDGFALKVAIPYGDNDKAEHFWLVGIERADGKYSGVINNTPAYATHVALGQRYEFGEAEISDWLFMRNGKMVGNETMRPLLKRLPKQRRTGTAHFWRRREGFASSCCSSPACAERSCAT